LGTAGDDDDTGCVGVGSSSSPHALGSSVGSSLTDRPNRSTVERDHED
jgi:hypothetical protein